MIFFDTSVLVAAFCKEEKLEKAKELVKKVFFGEIEGYISTQVLAELFYVLHYKKKIDLKTCKMLVEAFKISKNWKILEIRKETINKAIEIKEKYNILFWDALIVATMLENNIKKILTLDEEFKKVKEIEVILI